METEYDKAVKRVEEILHEMESTEAMSLLVFKQKASEAKQLIDFCRKELFKLEEDLRQS